MSKIIQFDENAAKGIERLYQTPDVVGQRSQMLYALGLKPGQRVLDIGVGPGLLAFDMAQMVGDQGHVAGIDLSEPMIAMTTRRCTELPWTDFKIGDATKLEYDDDSFDVVTSTQVYEYVSDMPAALEEVRRVLRPGGRVMILDTDWDSVVWHTSDHARMRRVMDAWDAHLHDPHLPASLGTKLSDAGFQVDRVDVIPLLNRAYHPNCYSFGILFAIQNFARQNGIDPTEADAWATELRELGDAYFFSINRYLFSATSR